jgi:hypothetical protein
LLLQALVHMLKLVLLPGDLCVQGWRAEVEAALSRARRRFKPSMAQLIDVQNEYQRSIAAAAKALGQPLVAVPLVCPFNLSELLDPASDLDTLLARLTALVTAPPPP